VKRAIAACGLILIAIAIAACGGDDKKDSFADAYNPLNADLLAFSQKLAKATEDASRKSDAELATEYDGLGGDLRAINERLKQLDPPDDLKDELDGMTRDLDSTAGDLEDIGAAAKRDDKSAAEAATRELLKDSAKVNQNQNKLAEATGSDKGSA
jgi:hypothetical protein